MKKIIFHLNCLAKGGAERVVTNLAHQFADNGYEVIIATEWVADVEYKLKSNVKRIHVGLTEKDEKKHRGIQYILRIEKLRELIKKEKPDIVIAFMKKANYRATMAIIGIKIPIIFSVRMDPKQGYDSKMDRLFTKLFLERADGCVFQTRQQQKFFPKKIQKKSKIILNPINEKYIGRKIFSERSKQIVHVGRLVDFKNQISIVKAFQMIESDYPEHILKLYGEDSRDGTKETLEEYIKSNNLENRIYLMGDSDDLESEIEGSCLFILNSNDEGMPNALMEAMALGLPVISTDCDCGGPATLIRHMENGYLIPVKDTKKLEEAIRFMLDNPQKADEMGNEARKIKNIASGDEVFNQWKRYVDELSK